MVTQRAIEKEEIKELILIEKSKPCTDCGHCYPPYVMDFDHLDASKKKFNLSLAKNNSLSDVEEELAKCELVCSNCHREREYVRRQFRGSPCFHLPIRELKELLRRSLLVES